MNFTPVNTFLIYTVQKAVQKNQMKNYATNNVYRTFP